LKSEFRFVATRGRKLFPQILAIIAVYVPFSTFAGFFLILIVRRSSLVAVRDAVMVPVGVVSS
jgi:hypothetical protein